MSNPPEGRPPPGFRLKLLGQEIETTGITGMIGAIIASGAIVAVVWFAAHHGVSIK